MTTIRLTSSQKRQLEKAQAILVKASQRRISQGETVAALAEFALRNRVLLAKAQQGPTWIPEDDPFYDTSIAFDLGASDERTHDRTLYGRR
jgi:hypothetical protein